MLLARIYEVFPLRGADMRIKPFITEAAAVRDILIHLGEPIAPPLSAHKRNRHRTTNSINVTRGRIC